ncbi:putative dna directed rna polymerase iii subunit protein [Venturia nashicola]|nr:putative dna directed rna polymerase iii subunit protein [Venturia nashicola]
MKQHLAELLAYAVGNALGGHYTPVFSALTEFGRLTLRNLSQRTGQPLEVVAQALCSLVEQNLVLYFAGSDRNSDASYEVNWQNSYNLTIRAGTLRKLITERHGKLVGDVFGEVLVTGLARVGDIIERLRQEPNKHDSPRKGSVNGDAVSEEAPAEQHSDDKIEVAIYTLLGSGILLPCQTRHFWPEYDLHQEAEMTVKISSFPSGCNTKKDRDLCAEKTGELLRKWRDQPFNFVKGAEVTVDRSDRKREWIEDEEESVSSKRQKNANGVNGTYGHSNNLLPVGLEISVNYEKCNVMLRTVQLSRWAARQVGNTTSRVYEAALKVIEGKILRCHDPIAEKKPVDPKAPKEHFWHYEDLSPPLTAKEVSALLDKAIDLDQGLRGEETNAINGHSEAVATTNGHVMSLPERVTKIEQHLTVLCTDTRDFVVKEEGSERWRIPLYSLVQKLIQAEVENTITARFGKLSAASARILNANGVLDVKQIAQLAIVKPDQVQMAVTPILKAGYISAQELPRDNNRTVERSIWAYSYNAIHARQRLLDYSYKTMARLLQRLEHERGRRRTVLEKAARTDVASNEMKYLRPAEREALRRCREIEEFLDRYVIRIDELVATLRDFTPMIPAQNDFDQVRGHKHLNV